MGFSQAVYSKAHRRSNLVEAICPSQSRLKSAPRMGLANKSAKSRLQPDVQPHDTGLFRHVDSFFCRVSCGGISAVIVFCPPPVKPFTRCPESGDGGQESGVGGREAVNTGLTSGDLIALLAMDVAGQPRRRW